MSEETQATAQPVEMPQPQESLTLEIVQSMLGARDIQIQTLSTALARAQQRVRELEARLKDASSDECSHS